MNAVSTATDLSLTTAAADTGDATDARVMRLLAGHVPLALIADLVAPSGPQSQEILDAEGLPSEHWWDHR